MEIGKKLLIIVTIILMVFLALSILPLEMLSADAAVSGGYDIGEEVKFNKQLDIWFMTFLIAILMMFIKKFEWGVATAVLLSAAGSYVTYLAVSNLVFGAISWDETILIKAVVCAITVVIAIGVFIGTLKMWQYIMVGILFAPVYILVEWVCGNVEFFGALTSDPGGAILVHMCAAYFGLGVAMAIRDKRPFNEPMHSTTHSITFVWLASMLLFMLWPSFVTAFVAPEEVAIATAVCYMGGMGSILSAYLTCQIVQGKVNPAIYAYALLAGPVAMSPVMLSISPWFSFGLGIVAGILSTLCFIYLQPWFCKKLGVMDVMGVHNLHGMAGWLGVALSCVIMGSLTNLASILTVMAITLSTGLAIGFVLRLTRGTVDPIMDDNTDFIRNEDPANPES